MIVTLHTEHLTEKSVADEVRKLNLTVLPPAMRSLNTVKVKCRRAMMTALGNIPNVKFLSWQNEPEDQITCPYCGKVIDI